MVVSDRERVLLRALAQVVGVGEGARVGWLVRGFHRELIRVAEQALVDWAALVDGEREWDERAWCEVLGVAWDGDGDSPTPLDGGRQTGEAGLLGPEPVAR